LGHLEHGPYIESNYPSHAPSTQKKKHGAPFVDDEDVPDHLKSTAAPAKENEWDTDANHFARWDWVLDEMIFAFECKTDDSWEEAFRSGEHDHENSGACGPGTATKCPKNTIL
jgi:hypothetical protein